MVIYKRTGVAVVVLAIVSYLVFELTLVAGRQEASESATSFCTNFKSGLNVPEALALMRRDTTIKDIYQEPDAILASFGSGCHCPIQVRQGKAYAEQAWCDF